MTKQRKPDREKIKLEISKIISENNEFLNKIKHYRSIVAQTILSGCEGYDAWVPMFKNFHEFAIIGTNEDIIKWHQTRQSNRIAPYATNLPSEASEFASMVTEDIMSLKLLEEIDEAICTTYFSWYPTNSSTASPATIICRI